MKHRCHPCRACGRWSPCRVLRSSRFVISSVQSSACCSYLGRRRAGRPCSPARSRDSASNPDWLRSSPSVRSRVMPPPRELDARASRHKGVIRARPSFGPKMVTGEFYARVTTNWITRASARARAIRDKRPARRWLRSSSHNCADQGSTVTESLSQFLGRSTGSPKRLKKRQLHVGCLLIVLRAAILFASEPTRR
jgi:hypothetical protein